MAVIKRIFDWVSINLVIPYLVGIATSLTNDFINRKLMSNLWVAIRSGLVFGTFLFLFVLYIRYQLYKDIKPINQIKEYRRDLNNIMLSLYHFFDSNNKSNFLMVFSIALEDENIISRSLFRRMEILSKWFLSILQQLKYNDKVVVLSEQRLKTLVEDLHYVIINIVQTYIEFRYDIKDKVGKNSSEVFIILSNRKKELEGEINNFKSIVLRLDPLFIEILGKSKSIQGSIKNL